MAFLLAFLAACAFALGSVLQQKGTVETSAGARDPRFLVQILRRPVWLAGLGLQVVGWVLQAFVFLLAGSPQVGTSQPDAAAWWAAILATVVVIGLLVGFGRYRTGAVRALLLGSAAGVLFALQAAVTKVFRGHGKDSIYFDQTNNHWVGAGLRGLQGAGEGLEAQAGCCDCDPEQGADDQGTGASLAERGHVGGQADRGQRDGDEEH
jgi:hypothetical protein